MLRVYEKDGLLLSAIITGPRHVWLGLRIERGESKAPKIIARPPVGDCSHGVLDEVEIIEAVTRGVLEANTKFGSQWRVAELEYILDDSPAYDLYTRLAFAILSAVESGAVSIATP